MVEFGPGSAQPLPDGSTPSPAFTIKADASSMLFHTPESPYHVRTQAEVWFDPEASAPGRRLRPLGRRLRPTHGCCAACLVLCGLKTQATR